ncbi:MAG: hypothetical protein JW863_02050 [Chitinispirillaceae bacterium]|nr:hypothetical protein [Chitinispirillaceae bacterium]
MNENAKDSSISEDITGFIPVIVNAARTGDYAQTASHLNRFLQKLQQELSKGYIAADGLSKLTYSLETLLSMQRMKNWIAFADILEYEFLPLWRELAVKPAGPD